MKSAASIEQSPAFRKWGEAFQKSTGVDVHLVGDEVLDQNLACITTSTDLCDFLCLRSSRCASCRRRFAERLQGSGSRHAGPFAMRCFAGMTVTALPVKLGDESNAFLYTSPAFLVGRRPVDSVDAIAKRIGSGHPRLSTARVRELAGRIPVCGRAEFKATITLFRLLAEHISHMSRQMLLAPENGPHDSIAVRRCGELIEGHFTENLHLADVARELGVSRSYLSHIFGKHVGQSFTDYLAGRRVIEMKRLLADPGPTITEALFAAGFQSVSQANRVFRASTGITPRQFRATMRS